MIEYMTSGAKRSSILAAIAVIPMMTFKTARIAIPRGRPISAGKAPLVDEGVTECAVEAITDLGEEALGIEAVAKGCASGAENRV